MDEIITLDYGSGGKKTSRLIEQYILPGFSNPALDVLGDGALIPGSGTPGAGRWRFPQTALWWTRFSSRAETSESWPSAGR